MLPLKFAASSAEDDDEAEDEADEADEAEDEGEDEAKVEVEDENEDTDKRESCGRVSISSACDAKKAGECALIQPAVGATQWP